jgi:hypothetical protein
MRFRVPETLVNMAHFQSFMMAVATPPVRTKLKSRLELPERSANT